MYKLKRCSKSYTEKLPEFFYTCTVADPVFDVREGTGLDFDNGGGGGG